jgi:hypothetical protein
VHLLDQRDMEIFGKVTLGALTDLPGQRQGSTFIDHMEHQGDTPAPHDTPIHHEDPRLHNQMPQQEIDIRHKIHCISDMAVPDPPGKAFDAALRLAPIRHVRRNLGQLCALTRYHAADERRKGCQMPGDCACGLARTILY